MRISKISTNNLNYKFNNKTMSKFNNEFTQNNTDLPIAYMPFNLSLKGSLGNVGKIQTFLLDSSVKVLKSSREIQKEANEALYKANHLKRYSSDLIQKGINNEYLSLTDKNGIIKTKFITKKIGEETIVSKIIDYNKDGKTVNVIELNPNGTLNAISINAEQRLDGSIIEADGIYYFNNGNLISYVEDYEEDEEEGIVSTEKQFSYNQVSVGENMKISALSTCSEDTEIDTETGIVNTRNSYEYSNNKLKSHILDTTFYPDSMIIKYAKISEFNNDKISKVSENVAESYTDDGEMYRTSTKKQYLFNDKNSISQIKNGIIDGKEFLKVDEVLSISDSGEIIQKSKVCYYKD